MMPSRILRSADTEAGKRWEQSPYYEESLTENTPEPQLGWTFDGRVVAASQHPCSYHDYASPFSSGIFDELPDITFDETSPEATNPTTPSSPSYSHFPSTPNLNIPFTSIEENNHYPTPRLLPRPYSPLPTSLQHRRRDHQQSRFRRQSPQLSMHSHSPCLSSSLGTKRERSPDMGLNPRIGVGEDDSTPDPHFDEIDAEGDAAAGSEPYAQLIYRALKSVPGHSMVLKDIYEWFEKNTDKPQTSTSAKGWQNSIRHNLSMNGAFIKVDQVPPSDESKKGFIWVLADSALEEGVKSTTRYRKHNMSKKSCRTEYPAPQRQISGARGGKAAKKSAMLAGKNSVSRLQRSSRHVKAPSSHPRDTPKMSPISTMVEFKQQLDGLDSLNDERMSMLRSPFQQGAAQSYFHSPATTPLSSIAEPRLFQLTDVVGCADLGHAPIFCDDPLGLLEEGISSSQAVGDPNDIYMNYQFDDVTAETATA